MKQQFGTPFSASATGATAAYASVTGIAGTRYYVTDIGVSSDLATGAVYQVLDGTTPLWQGVISNGGPVERSFSTPLMASKGNSVTVQVSGTAASKANVAGFSFTL